MSTTGIGASVVVPVHGRAALTARCLDRVLDDLPEGGEVIVVDDASLDATPELLASYGDQIVVVTLPANAGFAAACNAGAASARGELIVFLNNDTEPQPGWLSELTAHALAHPEADVVGAKLLYPNGTIQHAGVVIGQDGYPHNLYAGLPSEHPAANHVRRLQAVTGACMLVRREAFERAGGFDTAYLNSLEDVDLCLRIADQRDGNGDGAEVHYCPTAVLTHLESASRGRDAGFERSVARWRERWRESARRDDLSIYSQDGLLAVEYRDTYPQRLTVSPLLGVVDEGREREIERLLEAYSGQVSVLLAEVIRLTALLSQTGATSEQRRAAPAHAAMPAATAAAAPTLDHQAFLAEAGRLEEEAHGLQRRIADRRATPPGASPGSEDEFVPNRRLGYRRLADRVCAAVAGAVPAGSAVLVVSRGDRELVRVAEREARHFPQDADGGYRGWHPRDSEDAIEHLEDLRARGAEFLVLPSVSYWWLDHYADFAQHLSRYPVTDEGVCSIYRLRSAEPAARRGGSA